MKTKFLKWSTLLIALFWAVSANAQNYETLYETNFTNPPAAGASWTLTSSAPTFPSGTNAWPRAGGGGTPAFTNWMEIGGTNRNALLVFSTPLQLVSNGTNRGIITIEWGASSNREVHLGFNTGSVTSTNTVMADAITTSADRNFVRTIVFPIPDNVAILNDLLIRNPGGSGMRYFTLKIETYASGPSIKEFTLDGITVDNTPSTNGSIVITSATAGTVTINKVIPYATDLSSIVPIFVLGQDTEFANAADETANNKFSMLGADPLVWTASYELRDKNGIQANRTYAITVNKLDPSSCGTTGDNVRLNNDFKVTFRGNTINGTVNNTTKTITFTIPFTTTTAELQTGFAPTFTTAGLLCTGAGTLASGCLESATTQSGTTVDFSGSVTNDQNYNSANRAVYTLMPQDGVACEYHVEITRAAADKNCSITDFSLGIDKEYVVFSGTTITITIPENPATPYDLSQITPTITTNSKAATPITAIPDDYSAAVDNGVDPFTPVQITVQAEDTNEPAKIYEIIIKKDGTAPVLKKEDSKPLDGSTDNSLAGMMKLVYDEDIVAGTGSITLQEKGGANPVTIPLISITINGKEAKFNFSGLTDLTEYELVIPAGVFEDRYGNEVVAETIEFKTADGTLKNFPYSGCMEGENFEVPAFITGVTYNPAADVKATVPNQYGAYEIPAGGSLTITTEQAGTIVASVYALGGNRNFSITTTSGKSQTGSLYNYENRGTSIQLLVNEGVAGGTPFEIKINNTGTGSIFIPFIYISENGQPGLIANEACCK
jgi:hypothetical protein